MIKSISVGNREIEYTLEYKRLKNINLRIKSDGTIHVSANKLVHQKVIDDFLVSKADFILRALDKYKNKQKIQKQYFSENEIRYIITALCQKSYPYFQKLGIKYPQIKFRKMVSRWGSCHSAKGILTFNTNLMYADLECIEYVVLHEFTHFLQANHSGKFYEELSKVCPDWKKRRKRLKEINLQ